MRAFLLVLMFFALSPVAMAQNAGAPARPGSARWAAFPALAGLKMHGDAVLLGSSSTSLASAVSSKDAVQRLLLLAYLKIHPEMFDQPESTATFVDILDPAEREKYVTWVGWIGNSQFEKEDRRAAFIANEKTRIFRQGVDLPLAIEIVEPVSFRDYDMRAQMLTAETSQDSNLAQPPFRLSHWPIPNRISMSEAQARQLIGLQTRLRQERAAAAARSSGTVAKLVAVTRYRLVGLRPWNRSVLLDMVPLSLGIFSTADLDRPLLNLPLPGSTRGQAASASPQTPPLLDPIYPRLLAAKLQPQLLDNEAFLRETFRLRRSLEQRIVKDGKYNNFLETTNWPLFMSSTFLTSDVPPDTKDLAAFRGWMERGISTVGDTVRFDKVCRLVETKGVATAVCAINAAKSEGDRVTIDLRKVMDYTNMGWDFRSFQAGWQEEARAAVAGRVPGAVAAAAFPAGGDIPTIIALSANPAWFGVPAPVPLENATLDLDLKVKRAEMVSYGSEGKFLLIELDPLALVSRIGNGPEKVSPIQGTADAAAGALEASTTSGLGKYDILGFRLGMPIAEAVATFTTNPDNSDYVKVEEKRPWDVIFADAVTFARPELIGYKDKVTLFFDASRTEKPVIAIGRRVDLSSRNLQGRTAANAALLPSLQEKYGSPDFGSPKDNDTIYWGVQPLTKARMKAGEVDYKHRCSVFEYRNWSENPGSYIKGFGGPTFYSTTMRGGCGEVLGIDIFKDFMSLFLVDDSIAEPMRKAAAAREPTPPPPAPIKF